MTAQNMDSPTNPVEASGTPSAMTVAQIDQALRDFVLQDTTHLRRDAETASQGASRREPEAAAHLDSELARRMAGASLNELDETIVGLSHLRDFLHAEGERIKRELSVFLQLNQVAVGSTKSIVDNIVQWKNAAHSTVCAPERGDFATSALPPPPSTATRDVFIPPN